MTVWIYVTSSREYNTSLSRLPRPRSRAVNFFKHGAAALALGAIGFLDLDMHAARAVTRALREFHGGHDEEVAKLVLISRENRTCRVRRGDGQLRLQTLSDPLAVALFFERFHYLLPHREKRSPILLLLPILLWNGRVAEHVGCGGKHRQMNAFDAVWRLRQVLPNLFTGKTQDGRQQPNHRLADAPNRSLGRAAAERVGCVGVEAVLDDIKVEGAE